jgi:hypothetical protein
VSKNRVWTTAASDASDAIGAPYERSLSRRQLLRYGLAAPAALGMANVLGVANIGTARAALPAAVAG